MERRTKIELYMDDDIIMSVIVENKEAEPILLAKFTEIKNGGGISMLVRHDRLFNIIEYHLDSDSLDTIINSIC